MKGTETANKKIQLSLQLSMIICGDRTKQSTQEKNKNLLERGSEACELTEVKKNAQKSMAFLYINIKQ